MRPTPSLAVLAMVATLMQPGVAAAASDSSDTSIPIDAVTQLQVHTTANCVAADGRCYFTTAANLMTPAGPTGFPGDLWSRQTITLRSSDRDVWQEAGFSAPTGMPRDVEANHDNVLSKMYKSVNNAEISVTTFGGGPPERFRVDGDSTPTDWRTGLPATDADFIVCTHIQVVFGGHNIASPSTCSHTTF